MDAAAREVLEFWLGDARRDPRAVADRVERWFQPDAALDAEVRARFAPWVERAAAGELDAWKATPQGLLALVILLDQFPRNLHRGTAAAFAHDAAALALCREALESGADRALTPVERTFLYLPLEHTEDREAQARCVRAFEKLAGSCQPAWREVVEDSLGYARAHQEVIERFGRFPHRNAALGRASTPEEERYLAEGGGFG